MIDFRSDTVTKPTAGMLEAMMKAEVGDDVFGDDPSVNELERKAADLFGMEASLFCPSGTMTNQVAVRAHTQPGDELICDELSHAYQYEGGGIAMNSGVQVKLLHGDHGRISAEQVRLAINPDDVHKPKSSIVCLENTSNRGGGSCYDLSEIQAIKEVCLQNNLKLHLDGARLFNAIVARREGAKDYGQIFDSISVCLSKGLGCPVGSILLGTNDFIKKARRIRKVFGGGMRQAGYLAAAGIYALNNHIERLADDHKHAKEIAQALFWKEYIMEMMPVETNIIIFELKPGNSALEFTDRLKQLDILVIPMTDKQVRMVVHLDITEEMVHKTIGALEQI